MRRGAQQVSLTDFSQYGKLKMSLMEDSEPTPLQHKLEGLGDSIGKLGISFASLTLAVMLAYMLLKVYQGQFALWSLEASAEVVKAVILAIIIVVAAVPEGLPLAVTIALAYSVNKMKDENNLVRTLSCTCNGSL